MHQLKSHSHQSYFINALLWSTFGASVTLAGAINQKMVLVKFVQDQKMNTFRYGKRDLKKICLTLPLLLSMTFALNIPVLPLCKVFVVLCLSKDNCEHFFFFLLFLVLTSFDIPVFSFCFFMADITSDRIMLFAFYLVWWFFTRTVFFAYVGKFVSPLCHYITTTPTMRTKRIDI